MPRKPSLDETKLSKMEIRKLNALRTSVGDALGTKTFMQWQKSRPAATGLPPEN